MSEHIARVCRNCYYQLRQIRKIKRSLTANSITLLVLASVHSRLDYCKCPVFVTLVAFAVIAVCVELCSPSDSRFEAF